MLTVLVAGLYAMNLFNLFCENIKFKHLIAWMKCQEERNRLLTEEINELKRELHELKQVEWAECDP